MSQLLARDLGTRDQPLVTELVKIMQEERQQRDAEGELKAKLLENRDDVWPYRPQMSDYCGFAETDGRYQVHELKNRAGGCTDWKPGLSTPRECSACKHRQIGPGFARDQVELVKISQVARASAIAGHSTDQLTPFVQQVGTKKAFEASAAYYVGRLTTGPAEYLSTCAVFSTARDAVPCVSQNPHDTCEAWDDGKPKAVKAPESNTSISDALTKLQRDRAKTQ
jgi:hypothetical protein